MLAEINKIIKADVAVHADAKEALQLLTQLVLEKKHAAWLEEFKIGKQKELKVLEESAKALSSDEIKMDEVVKLLSEITNGEAVVVTDVGQHQMITCTLLSVQ